MAKLTDNSRRRVAVNVNLTVGMLEHLDDLAAQQGLSRSALIRKAIEQVLEDAEDRALLSQAEAILDDPEAASMPWEEAKARLGL